MFKINNKLNKEIIEKFDNDSGIFYRFQNPEYEIEGEYLQSWGTIFSSAEEARECAEEWGMAENDAVLPGKSCMSTFREIMAGHWICETGDDDVLLVFEGIDTHISGHDGECVAEYIKPIAVFSLDDAIEFYENNYD